MPSTGWPPYAQTGWRKINFSLSLAAPTSHYTELVFCRPYAFNHQSAGASYEYIHLTPPSHVDQKGTRLTRLTPTHKGSENIIGEYLRWSHGLTISPSNKQEEVCNCSLIWWKGFADLFKLWKKVAENAPTYNNGMFIQW